MMGTHDTAGSPDAAWLNKRAHEITANLWGYTPTATDPVDKQHDFVAAIDVVEEGLRKVLSEGRMRGVQAVQKDEDEARAALIAAKSSSMARGDIWDFVEDAVPHIASALALVRQSDALQALQAAENRLSNERSFGKHAITSLQAAEAEIERLKAENTRIRAALAVSKDPCIYCSLPAEDWAKCQHGFPGCDRGDDAMGCQELGASLALKDAEAQRDAAEAARSAAEAREAGLRRTLTSLARRASPTPDRYAQGVEDAAKVADDRCAHYARLVDRGKGEHGVAGYVRDETWAGWLASRSVSDHIAVAIRTLSPPPASANADLVQAVQALKDAIELAEEGWVYADAYFRDKWDLDGRLAILREVLSLIEGKTGDRDG